jgi:hypothetical protein
MDRENSRVWTAPVNLVRPCGYNHFKNFFGKLAVDSLLIAQRVVFNSIVACSRAAAAGSQLANSEKPLRRFGSRMVIPGPPEGRIPEAMNTGSTPTPAACVHWFRARGRSPRPGMTKLNTVEMGVAIGETEIGGVAEAGGFVMGGAGLLREFGCLIDPVGCTVVDRHRCGRAFHDRRAGACGDQHDGPNAGSRLLPEHERAYLCHMVHIAKNLLAGR